jgi:hypothetical protein
MKKLLIILALAFCAYVPALPAFAAFAQVSGAKGSGLQGVATPSLNFTGVNLIVIGQITYNVSPISSVSDSLGNTYLPLTKQVGGTLESSQLFYAFAPTVSSSMTFSPGNSSADIYVVGFSGATASPFDQQNGSTNANASSIAPGAITPGQNNELTVVMNGYYNGTGIPSNGDVNYTLVAAHAFAGGVSWGGGLWYSIQTTAASTNPTISWSVPSNDATAAIASFKAASVTPPTTFTGMIINFFGWF